MGSYERSVLINTQWWLAERLSFETISHISLETACGVIDMIQNIQLMYMNWKTNAFIFFF